MLAGPCRCLRALAASWDADLQEIILSILSFFLLASPGSFKAGWLSATFLLCFSSCPFADGYSSLRSTPFWDQGRCPSLPVAPSFQHESLFYSLLRSRAFKPHLMQPLGSLQHCCLLMFTLLWDSTAPGSHMASQCYPRMTLLESPLAQRLRHRHRTVSPAAEPGVGSRASWRDAQRRAGSATFPSELPGSAV